jgi:2-C-methyl-D-erythritol 2,4-cyclodiphosphate synthase
MAQVTGIGYDSHKFTDKRKLILGGVPVEHDRGLAGHSDADVLCHAVIDSILGACGLPDIGQKFPDTDPEWKDASSIEMLKSVVKEISGINCTIVYIDAVIICERPKLLPYVEDIRESLANAMSVSKDRVNIKAKTNEKMGFTGRMEGMAVIANASMERLFNV